MQDWLGEQTAEFRAAIKLVVIDPSAPYAGRHPGRTDRRRGSRSTNGTWWRWRTRMLTEVRQRVTRDRWVDAAPPGDPVGSTGDCC